MSVEVTDPGQLLAVMRWRHPGDRGLCERDVALYGNAYVLRGADGLVDRVDPATIEPSRP